MTRAATLFDADAASYTGTVEVIGVIYKAEDDGYAVLEVQETESGEGFALVGPVAHLDAGDRAEVSGEWQTHNRYGRQLRAQGALPLDPADREGQVAYLTSLRHIGQKRAERLLRRARRGGAAGDRRRPAARLRLAARGQRRPGRRGDPVLVREPGDPRPPRAAGARTGSPTWRRRSTPATASAR